jgi:hypothetical protein
MKVPPSIWIGSLTAGVLLGALLGFAAETHPAPVIDSKEVARRVADRNIFDPERQPRIRGESRPTPKPKVVVAADSPEFGLVGIISYPRGTFAFFDGNASEFQKTLQLNAVIAGQTLSTITSQSITLMATNRPPNLLKVGQRLRQDSEGVWQLVTGLGGEGFKRLGSAGGATGTSSASSTTPSEDPPGSDEILKRLLKKREQEMK